MDVTTIRCVCPGAPHPDGDTITFIDKPDFRRAVAMQKSITILKGEMPDAGAEDVLAVLAEAYLLHGIVAWSLVYGEGDFDEKGKPLAGRPIPVSRAEITARLLSEVDVAMLLTDEVDDLYSEVVLLPLLRRASNSLQASPTTDGTSPQTGSSPISPKRSSRSSTTTTPTADIATTSSPPDGDFRSSPRAVSAA